MVLEDQPNGFAADALHVASAAYLRDAGVSISFATYDGRLAEAARSLDFDLYPLS